jgi:long-chain fatty acid transport protein
MSRSGAGWIVFILVVAGGGFPAGAVGLLETFGAPDSRHPFAARVLGDGPSAAYFNPGLLLFQEPGLRLGASAIWQDLDVELRDRPPGVDVTETIYRARILNPDGSTSRLVFRPLPSDRLRSSRGSYDPDSFSLVVQFGANVQLIENRLALGFYSVLPTGAFGGQKTFFPDEREQYFSNSLHFELFEDRLDGSMFCLALAGRPLDWLWLGAGVVMTNVSEVTSTIFVPDAADQETADINTDISINMRFEPHFGVVAELLEGLLVTGTLHLEARNDVDGTGDIQLWDYPYPEGQDSLDQTFAFSQGYNPLRASLGAAYRGGGGSGLSWAAGASVLWSRWSEYRDRHQQRPADAWSDNWAVSLGSELSWGDHHAALDAVFVPSPVPDQEGRSNYVDNHRLGFGLGWQWRPEFGAGRLVLTAQLQMQHLFNRQVQKSDRAANPVFDEFPESIEIQTGEVVADSLGFQTNNPGYPGFSSRGWLWAAGFSAAYNY